MNQVFQVQGMSCGHCVGTVTQAIQALDPAAEVSVDLASGKVDVKSERNAAEITAAIEEEGYRVAA